MLTRDWDQESFLELDLLLEHVFIEIVERKILSETKTLKLEY